MTEREPPQAWTLKGRGTAGHFRGLEVGVTCRVRWFTPQSSHLQYREV